MFLDFSRFLKLAKFLLANRYHQQNKGVVTIEVWIRESLTHIYACVRTISLRDDVIKDSETTCLCIDGPPKHYLLTSLDRLSRGGKYYDITIFARLPLRGKWSQDYTPRRYYPLLRIPFWFTADVTQRQGEKQTQRVPHCSYSKLSSTCANST